VHLLIPVHSIRHDWFGRAVRETRARRGLSQEQLGFMCGLHRNYVGAIERGEINPTLKILYKLEIGLGLPVWELLRLADDRRAQAATTSLEALFAPRHDRKAVRS
jgi:transcriptional regulator with XRE-family HTH domain